MLGSLMSYTDLTLFYTEKCRGRSGYGIRFNPFAPRDFAEKCVLKLVEWFSGHCHAIES